MTRYARPTRISRHSDGVALSSAAEEPAAALRIALVNNMPDAAFTEADQQFTDLLMLGSRYRRIGVERYYLPAVPRGELVRRTLAESYRDVSYLYAAPPDALIVTGAEPAFPDLRDEPYWTELRQLLLWTQDNVPSALLSCLASHAAVLAYDGAQRTKLDEKCSGVFSQTVRTQQQLVAHVSPVEYPHSRLNAIDSAVMATLGYSVLLESNAGGWTVATAERGHCFLVLLQGHPEYAPSTLLREYRRDVRRYLDGVRATYPPIPVDYLDAAGHEQLEMFKARALARERDASLIEDFPFDAVAAHIKVAWRRASETLICNWLAEVEQRLRSRAAPV